MTEFIDEFDGEMLGILLVKYNSINPSKRDWYQRCHWVSMKLGFHIDHYPHNNNHYMNGLDGLYKKLKSWSIEDKKLYWKYLDLVDECIHQLTRTDIVFTFRGDNVILLPKPSRYQKAIKWLSRFFAKIAA